MRNLYMNSAFKALYILICLFLTTATYSQYCAPAVGTECDISAIKRFSMANIDNNNGYCDEDLVTGGTLDGYSDYTAMTVYMKPGSSYQVSLEILNGLITDFASLWIDWNLDQTWSEDELTLLAGNDYTVGTYTAVVLVPLTALEDSVGRIRVISDFLTPPTDPCAQTYSGEVEDYSFIVTDADPPTTGGGGPAYCPGLVGTECTQSAIKRFAVADIDNDNDLCDKDITTSAADGYSDYTEIIATMNPLMPYPVTVEINSSLILDQAVLWVYWNVDGTWSMDEYTPLVGNGYVINTFTGVITPPLTAVTGKVGRIRVIGDFTQPALDPCVETFSGEVEDYSFILLPTGDELPGCVDVTTVFPADSSQNNCEHLTLKWNMANLATGYKLTVQDTLSGVYIVSELLLTDTSYTFPAPLNPNTTYRWIAQSLNGDTLYGFQCDSAIFTTSANQDPMVDITTVGDTLTICKLSDIQLLGNPSLGTTPYIFNWSTSGGNIAPSSSQDAVYYGDTSGVFKVVYRVSDANGCSVVDSVFMTVRDLPAKPGFLAVSDSTVCDGNTAELNLTGYEGTVAWAENVSPDLPWTAATVNAMNDTVFEYPNVIATRYVKAAVSDGFCSDSSNAVRIYNVALSPMPAIINTGRDSICIKETTILQVTNYSSNLTWNDANSTQDDSLLVSAPGIYIVSYVDSNLCNSTSSYEIYPNIQPAKPLVLSNPVAPYCVGDSVTLSSFGMNLNWQDTTGFGSQTDSIIVRENGIFLVSSTNTEGCTTTSDSVSVVFNLPPTKPQILDLSSNHCVGDSVQLQTTAANPVWNTGASTSSIYVYNDGDYIVTDTNQFGCGSQSDTLSIVFDAVPATPSIAQVGNELVADSTGFIFVWYDKDSVEVAVTNTAHYKPVKSGVYYVVVYNAAGCMSVPSAYGTFNGLGIEGISAIDDVIIYPNPTAGQLFVNLPGNKEVQAELLDGLGRILKAWSLKGGENKLELNVAPGVYNLKIGEQGIKRLIVY